MFQIFQTVQDIFGFQRNFEREEEGGETILRMRIIFGTFFNIKFDGVGPIARFPCLQASIECYLHKYHL